MKTLAQIENIHDLDSRLIHAAALLEAELRPSPIPRFEGAPSLGELVQEEPCFVPDGFIRDLNFALRVRNSIAHYYNGEMEPTTAEKRRSAQYLIRAIKRVRETSRRNADPLALASQGFDSFVPIETPRQKTLKPENPVSKRRWALAVQVGLLVFSGSVVLSFYARESIPPEYVEYVGSITPVHILGGSALLGVISFFGMIRSKTSLTAGDAEVRRGELRG